MNDETRWGRHAGLLADPAAKLDARRGRVK
jgi:hypothetical protein